MRATTKNKRKRNTVTWKQILQQNPQTVFMAINRAYSSQLFKEDVRATHVCTLL